MTLLDILEARRLVREAPVRGPLHVLSTADALRWCHLSDHRLAVCTHCRGDHDGCERIVREHGVHPGEQE